MTPEALLWTAVAALIVSAGGTIGMALIGRRFGLGPLAQRLNDEQSELIRTLQVGRSEDRAEIKELHDEIKDSERKRKACEEEIGRMKRHVRALESEVLELYRRVGQKAPRRLETRRTDAE